MDQADIKLVGAIEAHLEEKDARIAELEGYLRDLLAVDQRISDRLMTKHGWTDQQKHEHGCDLETRMVIREQARVALSL